MSTFTPALSSVEVTGFGVFAAPDIGSLIVESSTGGALTDDTTQSLPQCRC
jgi:hypothetical protein